MSTCVNVCLDVSAGVLDALGTALERGWLPDKDTRDEASKLKVAYTIQQNHVD